MKLIIIILLSMVFVGLILLVVYEEDKVSQFPEEEWCMDNIKKLSCESLLECYDACDDQDWITHSNECREGYKARLWKCYGANEDGI